VKRYDQAAGFILAGGASSRMGRDKALLEVGDLPMLVRTARLLEPLVVSVTVIGPPESYAPLGLRVVPDDEPGLGPLGGLATALRISESECNLVVGCDLPYLPGAWLDWLLARAVESRGDAVVPESARGLEPLCAVYRARCAGTIRAAISRGERKLTDAVSALRIDKVSQAEWGRFSPAGRLFTNMNTPEDYAEARARLEGNPPK
jgi:molybdopterin-guanine dinucleotide biosynthesis protein A